MPRRKPKKSQARKRVIPKIDWRPRRRAFIRRERAASMAYSVAWLEGRR